MSEVPAKVFLSYSHDSPEHAARVLRLSNRLRTDGIETRLDQYVQGSPAGGWPTWMLDQLDWAEFVLIVCTETYYRRFRKQEEPGKGSGVTWEGHHVTQEFYDSQARSLKFVPVLFEHDHRKHIPNPLRAGTHYVLDSEANYQTLLKFLRGESGELAPPVGPSTDVTRQPAEPLTFASASRERIAPETLHYLCDRSAQEKKLGDVLVEHLGRTPRRALVCVIYGDAREAHGRFVDRLEGHSLPRRLRDFMKGDTIRFLRLHKPLAPQSTDDFADQFRTQITDQLQVKACANHPELLERLQAFRARLIATVMTVRSGEDLPAGKAYFELVRDFWAAAPDLPVGLHVIAFVSAKLESGETGGVAGRFRALLPWGEARRLARLNATLRERIAQFETPVGGSPGVVCRVLPELTPPTKADVDAWAARPDVAPQLREHLSEKRLNQIFAGETALPMDDLLEHLRPLVVA